jgi:probable F420-dependent oxidoreductase
MKLGFTSMNTPADIRPDVLAVELEQRGFDSLWIGEHSHIPVSRRTPYPAGGELPPQYLEMMDPFISLTMAAMATTDLLVCFGVALALEHDLFDLAKSVATLDVMSGGRVKFGVGVGWNQEELANHRPIAWSQRYRALAECVTALRSLWTDTESEFHGEFYDFDPVWSFPKPIQRPHPPIVCGTGGPLGTAHAVQWADEWAPVDVALGNVPKRVAKFRAAVAEAGRDDMPITIVTYGDPTIETLELYRELDIARVVVGAARIGWDDPSTTMPFMEHYTPFIEQLR